MGDELRERLRANAQRRRAERGLPKRREIAAALAEVIGHRVPTTDFLSVQSSDALMDAVNARVTEMWPQATWAEVSPVVFGGLATWADSVEGLWAYLAGLDGTELAGMPYVPVAPVLRSLGKLWKPPAYNLDLVLATSGAEDGLWIGWQEHAVDLWAWGALTPTMW